MGEVRPNDKKSDPLRWFQGAFLAVALIGAQVSAAEITVHVRADEPGDMISRYLYGQFAEHLGRGIYDGIWVGPDSEIPNTRGFREDVLSALQELHIPVIRWPGGCFADEYNWRDGIGPPDERPVRINTHWGWADETNAFGTHEFMDLIELLGSEAYIAGNVGSAAPREMAQWLEYMTADNDTELANLRRANGREEPWVVNFFGVGNETWGCGGNMSPEYYTDLFNRYSTFLKSPPGRPVKKIASGGSNEQTNWTTALIAGNVNEFGNRRELDGISHHYYTLPTDTWSRKGSAIGFPEEEWISTLDNAMRIDEYLTLNEAVLDEYDPDGHVGLYLDEWGTWYDADPDYDGGVLYQQNSIRDALVAALSFNIFHRHTPRLHMANIAQTVNVLQAVILTRGDEMILTPTYHAFSMYRPFHDSTFVPVTLDGGERYELGGRSVPHVSATSALTADGQLLVALVNLHAKKAVDVAVDVTGFRAMGATAQVLTGDAIDAHNTFENPGAVAPSNLAVEINDRQVHTQLPARSVSVITMDPVR
jgi:alpha-L-arabinofuranosidase